MALAILVVLVVAAVSMLIVLDRRRKEGGCEREDAPALDYINLFIGTLYIVLLSLVVVIMWQNISDVSGDVRTEGAGLKALVQTARQLPESEGQPLLKAAHDYAAAVLRTEWPPPAASGGEADQNAPAARILAEARAAVTHPVPSGAQAGTVEDQAIAQINTVADARDDRLAKSDDQTPTVLLIALAVLSAITIATPLALGLRADAVAFAGFVVTTALVCLAFWFVVDLQSPFHGLIHASQQPLRDVLAGA